MRVVADLHVHSKYSRATSRDMDVNGLSEWAKVKGIDVVGTGDFTHPGYLRELKEKLKPLGNGLFGHAGTHFILSVEVSNIFQKDGLKKIHSVILAPGFEVVEQVNEGLAHRGKLEADGRPTFGGMGAAELVELVMGVSRECLIIPAHVWTPWFGLFGANSGFDTVEDCYEDMSRHIFAMETGLSSDPAMNWRLSSLDRYSLVSNSDAHSPRKLGREANVFELGEVSYEAIADAIRKRGTGGVKLTYEFYPEEGKYHFDGHRGCGVRFSPSESRKHGDTCPVCRKGLTIGVMHRVEELADRENGFSPPGAVPFESIVPLEEIISKALGKGPYTKAVAGVYWKLVKKFGNELNALHANRAEIATVSGERVAEGVARMREGKVRVIPGYDGVYGEVDVFGVKKHEDDNMGGKQSSLDEFL